MFNKTNIQCVIMVAAMNSVRITDWLLMGEPLTWTRTSHFAALAGVA
jgi:hypothetical protein